MNQKKNIKLSKQFSVNEQLLSTYFNDFDHIDSYALLAETLFYIAYIFQTQDDEYTM